jgi:hypothetical protein
MFEPAFLIQAFFSGWLLAIITFYLGYRLHGMVEDKACAAKLAAAESALAECERQRSE